MADDIVTRLHAVSWLAEEGSEVTDLASAAANEILALRETENDLRMYAEQDSCEIELLRKSLERERDNFDELDGRYANERVLADQLAEVLKWMLETDENDTHDTIFDIWQAAHEAIATYNTARKGLE